MKKIIKALLLLPLIALALYGWGVVKNNKDVPMPDQAQLSAHLERSISWLVQHKGRILNDRNSMLWWMIAEAAKVSNEPRLTMLLNEFKQRNPRLSRSLWSPLFWPQQRLRIDETALYGLPDYNQHFIYSLHCAQNLLDEFAVIKAQNQPDFCFQSSHIYRPACVTHQLMGINFQQQQQCQPASVLKPLVSRLQADIVAQLTWDIRVIDVYLQRVMMLKITGAGEQIKPIWLQQILDHQLSDGGWGDSEPLLNLGSTSLVFSARLLSFRSPRSSFHATAQGVYLLTMLLEKA